MTHEHIVALIPMADIDPGRVQQALRLKDEADVEEALQENSALASDLGLQSVQVLAYALLAQEGGSWTLRSCDSIDCTAVGEREGIERLLRLLAAATDGLLVTCDAGADIAALRYAAVRHGLDARALESALRSPDRHVDAAEALSFLGHGGPKNLATVARDFDLPDPHHAAFMTSRNQSTERWDDLILPRTQALTLSLLQLRLELSFGGLSLQNHRASITSIKTKVTKLEDAKLLPFGTTQLIRSP